MAERVRAVVVVALVVVAGLPLLGAGTTPATALEEGPTIERTISLSSTPEEPGAVDVEVRYRIPDSVADLRTVLPRDVRDLTAGAWENPGNTTFTWEQGAGTPTLSYTLPANRTGVGATLEATPEQVSSSRYLFVDTGDWALVDVPRMPTQWRRSGPPVHFEESVEIDGEGVTGGEMAYLGPYEERTRTAHGQTLRLVVPEAASLATTPGAVLDSLAAASDRLRVGERDDSVFVVAAPQTLRWGARGLAGDDDAWVVADEALTQPDNPWLHEYLHTRQSFTTTDRTRWLTEATATYYGALLTLEQDLVDFERFRGFLAEGTEPPEDDAVLASPATWRGLADYLKGGLVYGGLDLQIRDRTDATRSGTTLLERLNSDEGRLTETDLVEAVRALGGDGTVEFLGRYTTTRSTPTPWGARTHARVFDADPPRFAYDLDRSTVRLEGPYRTVTGLPDTVVVGETVTVPATVRNVGGVAGEYTADLRVAGTRVASTSGRLEPGTTAELALSYEFQDPGIVEVSLGGETLQVRVAEPSAPTVTDLAVNRSAVDPGDDVAVTVTLRNDGQTPAAGSVPVQVGGETVGTVSVALDAGAEATRTVTVSFGDSGRQRVTAGGQGATVSVGEVGVTGPGFGPAAVLVALALLAAHAVRRRP